MDRTIGWEDGLTCILSPCSMCERVYKIRGKPKKGNEKFQIRLKDKNKQQTCYK